MKKIPSIRTMATLAPVGVGVAALTQAHYLLSHFGTIATVVGAVTGGAALLLKGRGKDEPEAAPEPTVDERVAELAAQLQRQAQALPRAAQVIDYTATSQEVTKRV